MLNTNYYINNTCSLLVYVENNSYYAYSLVNSRKFNELGKFYTLKIKNEIIKIKLFFFLNLYNNTIMKKNICVLKNKLFCFFKEIFYENKGKLKIIGRGWKITKYYYQLTVKLGFSHIIFLNTNPLFKNEFKKKNINITLFFLL